MDRSKDNMHYSEFLDKGKEPQIVEICWNLDIFVCELGLRFNSQECSILLKTYFVIL